MNTDGAWSSYVRRVTTLARPQQLLGVVRLAAEAGSVLNDSSLQVGHQETITSGSPDILNL